MVNSIRIINGILVELFNDILVVEAKSLQKKGLNDLSITEIHTIEAIGIEKSKSMSEIAENLKITVGTLTTAINRLLKKEYVRRNRDDQDRRIVLVELTEKGKEAYKIHDEFHKEMVEEMIEDLKVEEDKVLLNSLINLKKFFESKYDLK